MAVNFSIGYNRIFNVTDRNNKFDFIKSGTDKDGYIQIQLSFSVYELEN